MLESFILYYQQQQIMCASERVSEVDIHERKERDKWQHLCNDKFQTFLFIFDGKREMKKQEEWKTESFVT